MKPARASARQREAAAGAATSSDTSSSSVIDGLGGADVFQVGEQLERLRLRFDRNGQLHLDQARRASRSARC